MGRMVSFKANGRPGDGYLATPRRARGPGLIVVQELWGLVEHIVDVCERFSYEGFFALAPDLYHGEKATTLDAAGRMMTALSIAEAAKDMRGAANYLIRLDGVAPKQVASVGFSMGGQLALYAACAFPGLIGACVDFYGAHPAAKPNLAGLSGPVLAHFADRDTTVPRDAATALIEQLRGADKTVEAYFYEADHSFFNDQRRDVYDAQAATLAWQRTIDFLRKELV